MRVRDTVVVRSALHEDMYVPGIVIGHKLYSTFNVVEAFERYIPLLDQLMIPHSYLVITQEGFYQLHAQDPINGFQARRL